MAVKVIDQPANVTLCRQTDVLTQRRRVHANLRVAVTCYTTTPHHHTMDKCVQIMAPKNMAGYYT